MGTEKYTILKEGHLYLNNKGRNAMTFTEIADNGDKKLYVAYQGSKKSLARLVAETFIPIDQPSKYVVVHVDGNYRNCSADNLSWTTRSRLSAKKKKEKRGIHLLKGRWMVTISIEGRSEYLGQYDDKETAYAVFKKKYEEVHGVSPW